MILRRNVASQTVEIGPIRDDSGAAITTGASATVNNSAGAGTLTHRSNGIWAYTFTAGETNTSIVALRIAAAGGGIAETFATLSLSTSGVVDSSILTITDVDGNKRQITNPGGADDAPFVIGASGVADAVWDELLSGHTLAGSAGKALADINTQAALIGTQFSVEARRIVGSDIYAYVGSTADIGPITVLDEAGDPVTLTGMNLKFCIATKSEVTLAEYTPTISGSTFTVENIDAAIRAVKRELLWSLRDTDDGDEPVTFGNLFIIFAAKRQ